VQVIDQLRGKRLLPWEDMTLEARRKLGVFRAPMLRLLSRDPDERPSMAEFCEMCNSIFAATYDT
jgi:hypothetical protein